MVRPDTLRPDELDRLLERGWYRLHQTMFTCQYVLFNGVLRSAIWTRRRLQDDRWRKGLRKLIRRNEARFRTEVADAFVDDARRDLYDRYKDHVRHNPPGSLDSVLYDDSDRDLFDTREVRIFDGDRLVAFSWFDVGNDSVQSVLGVYDPAYSRFSLGFYTMVCEMRWGAQQGLSWFYPGYVLPGDAAMDYKLRMGEVEFWDGATWRPWEGLAPEALPTEQLDQALATAEQSLRERGVLVERWLYPLWEAGAWDPQLRSCLDHPYFLLCGPPKPSRLLVVWDPETKLYRLMRCRTVGYATMDWTQIVKEPVRVCNDLLAPFQLLAVRREVRDIADEVERWR